uniref:DUF1758 domain-containing protein n=1 Tax=Ascaris lumbricoides TaxID=6252 RepID=A0A0M3I6E0_ASCLU
MFNKLNYLFGSLKGAVYATVAGCAVTACIYRVYGKKNEDPSWDIDKLRNYIDKLTARKETIMRATSILTVQRKDCHEDRKPINCNSKETSAFSLTVSNCRGKKEDQAPKSKKRSCAFCGGHHWYKGHSAKDRARRGTCFYCREEHNWALCPKRESKSGSEKGKSISTRGKETVNFDKKVNQLTNRTAAVTQKGREKTTVLLLCKEVNLHNADEPEIEKTVSAFSDAGCQRSFVTEGLCDQLKKEKEKRWKKELNIYSGTRRETIEVRKSEASTVSSKKWEQPQLIIGADYFFDLVEGSQKLKSGFHLVKSKRCASRKWLSNLNTGRAFSSADRALVVATTTVTNEANIDQFWKLETLRIDDPVVSKEDVAALEQFKVIITKLENGHYVVSWPWKSATPEVPYNFGLCVDRLRSTLKRLRRDEEQFKRYDDTFRHPRWNPYLVYTTSGSANAPSPFPQNLQKSSIKLRVVFDSSAKEERGNSLRSELLRGSVMLNNLALILLRFRTSEYVTLSDVERAFLKLRVIFDSSAKEERGNSLKSELLRGSVMLNNLALILLRFRTSEYVTLSDVERAFLKVEI